MTISTKVLTVTEIKAASLTYNSTLSHDFEDSTYFLVVDGVRTWSFTSSKLVSQSITKIKKYNLGFGVLESKVSDEEAGLSQANEIGENPFDCSIICSNSELNEVVSNKASDKLTRKHTAFKSLEEMLTAKGNYRPSLIAYTQTTEQDAEEVKLLAEIYNLEQKLRGDSRRAFEG